MNEHGAVSYNINDWQLVQTSLFPRTKNFEDVKSEGWTIK